MAEKRDLTVHFMDGSKMSFSFPKQVTQDEFVSGRLDKILGKPALVVEADGAALMIPFCNIKYIQMYGVPKKLPDYVIRDATIEA